MGQRGLSVPISSTPDGLMALPLPSPHNDAARRGDAVLQEDRLAPLATLSPLPPPRSASRPRSSSPAMLLGKSSSVEAKGSPPREKGSKGGGFSPEAEAFRAGAGLSPREVGSPIPMRSLNPENEGGPVMASHSPGVEHPSPGSPESPM